MSEFLSQLSRAVEVSSALSICATQRLFGFQLGFGRSRGATAESRDREGEVGFGGVGAKAETRTQNLKRGAFIGEEAASPPDVLSAPRFAQLKTNPEFPRWVQAAEEKIDRDHRVFSVSSRCLFNGTTQ
jgi:hypothetical protein